MKIIKSYKLIFIIIILIFFFSFQKKPSTDVKFLNSSKNSNKPFSEAVQVGNMLYLSGQIGINPETNKLVKGGIKAETKQALKNIKTILKKYNSSMENVVKCTVMLADINEWSDMNSVYITFFQKNKPARSAFSTNGLAANARVEIECFAVINKK